MKAFTVALCIALLPVTADAQTPVASFAALPQRIKIEDEIYVLDSHHREIVGTIRTLSADSLEVKVSDGSRRRLFEDDVERIGIVHRATKKGAIAGAIVGLAFAVLGAGNCDCRRSGGATGHILVGVAISTLIGGGLGEMYGRVETVYRRAPPMR